MDSEFRECLIFEAKCRIKQSFSKDKVLMFFTRLIEDLKKNPSSDVFGRVMEIYYFFSPYRKANKKEIYDYFKNSDLSKNEGLILEDEEINYFKIIFNELDSNFKFNNGKVMKGRLKGILDKEIKKYMPNCYYLVDSYIIGKLICSMGGIENLIKKPSSTIQLIGAEKSLFRHKRNNSDSPKYGLLYYTKEIQESKDKGKKARQLANKLSIFLKKDYFTNFCPMMKHPCCDVLRASDNQIIDEKSNDRNHASEINSNVWDAKRSKWKAALDLSMDVGLNGNENILYLGASSGTTVGHLSNITNGYIFAVEKSSNMAIPLVRLAEERENIIPLFVDAHDVNYLESKIKDLKINILFQDIPSLDQVDIIKSVSNIVDNECKIFLSLKTFSISKKDLDIKNEIKKLEELFEVVDSQTIEKYHKGHMFFILKKK